MVYPFSLKIGVTRFFWMLFKNFEEKFIFETMPAHLTCGHSTKLIYKKRKDKYINIVRSGVYCCCYYFIVLDGVW